MVRYVKVELVIPFLGWRKDNLQIHSCCAGGQLVTRAAASPMADPERQGGGGLQKRHVQVSETGAF